MLTWGHFINVVHATQSILIIYFAQSQDAVESICSFYYAGNKLRSLLSFGIKYEVNITSEYYNVIDHSRDG